MLEEANNEFKGQVEEFDTEGKGKKCKVYGTVAVKWHPGNYKESSKEKSLKLNYKFKRMKIAK